MPRHNDAIPLFRGGNGNLFEYTGLSSKSKGEFRYANFREVETNKVYQIPFTALCPVTHSARTLVE